MHTINIGIVAHVDAGKTSLAERMLFETNVIDAIGRVDRGNTQTDSLELERKRGITIKASVVSFDVDGLKVNLIDTPGHADFIAEVERSLTVLDGVILVISAVEGVQAQTKILMSVLKKMQIPTILFVNKIDRIGAKAHTLLENIQEKLTGNVFPLYRVKNIGTKEAAIVENRFAWETDAPFLEQCVELAASNDEQLLQAYVYEEEITEAQVKAALRKQTQNAKAYPVYFGSAMTGVGVSELLHGMAEWLPLNVRRDMCRDWSGGDCYEGDPLSGVVFKIEREPSGEKVAYIRLFSGSLSVREEVAIHRKNKRGVYETHTSKVNHMQAFVCGKTVPIATVHAGDLSKVWGLKDVRIGDIVGEPSARIKSFHFATPQLETRVESLERDDAHRLYEALVNLAEEDPLIEVVTDDVHRDLYIRLFGDVQKEVIEATLKENYQLYVRFSETRIVCIEKPKGTGQALDVMGGANNPFCATVGLEVSPGPAGSGVTYRLAVELGSLPLAFHKAIEESVDRTLKQGLYGWEVTDVVVTLTHTGYSSPVTVAGDFRKLVPLVLMDALQQAGTDVYEPMHQFELTVPADLLSKTMFKLSEIDAVVNEPVLRKETFVLTGTLPVAHTDRFKRSLHSFTQGEGFIVVRPSGFAKMSGEVPTRARTDDNPLNRKDYLLHVLRAY